jgi:transcriptional regulator with XRE-family HTH domain
MLLSQQIRAARSLLGWDQNELARQSKVGITTIRRIEGVAGLIKSTTGTAWRLQQALEKAGIIFIESDDAGGPGVRLAEPRRARTR